MTRDTNFSRRLFLNTLTAGAALSIPGWSIAASNFYLPQDLPLTPDQTEGPFYPEVDIEKQLHNDTDLIRKLSDHEAARGQQIVVSGIVRNKRGEPINGSVVEVWQACASGRYNHSLDDDGRNKLDNNFQFWGRTITGKDGRYSFHTIIPGKYPGRFGRHIHYRIDAAGYRRLTTQCYFDQFGKDNARDGIYSDLTRKERQLVTIQVDKSDSGKNQEAASKDKTISNARPPASSAKPSVWRGSFDVVLA